MKKIFALVFILIAVGTFFTACNSDNKRSSDNKIIDSTVKNDSQIPEPILYPYTQIDISPMDMSYFPIEYPKLKMAHSIQSPPLARVIYSRPHLAGRKLFHDLLKYGEPWRLGANEVTELDLYKDASIQNKKIKSGRYSLYAIPEKDKWTIVFNSNLDTWGLQQDPSKDIARFEVKPAKNNSRLEYFTMVFDSTASGAHLLMAWDDIIVRLPIGF